MASLEPFCPGATVSLAATATTGRVALSRGTGNTYQIMVTAPAGGALTFVKFGSSTVEAAATDTPILPGTSRVFTISPVHTHMAGITASSTQTLYATAGAGQ